MYRLSGAEILRGEPKDDYIDMAPQDYCPSSPCQALHVI